MLTLAAGASRRLPAPNDGAAGRAGANRPGNSERGSGTAWEEEVSRSVGGKRRKREKKRINTSVCPRANRRGSVRQEVV